MLIGLSRLPPPCDSNGKQYIGVKGSKGAPFFKCARIDKVVDSEILNEKELVIEAKKEYCGTPISEIKFFVTPGHHCSYLPRKDAATLFVDPRLNISPKHYHYLSERGFRRSGDYIYRPHCQNCNACIPVRIQTQLFKMSRKQKRIWKKNQDIEISFATPSHTEEYFQLYAEYINARHHDGDMHPPSIEQFSSFLLSQWSRTDFIEMRLNGQLLGIAVTDHIENGLSAVYTFYAADAPQRSLGVFAILMQIHIAKAKNLPYVFLGYWIQACQKMAYKSEFKPFEVYVDNQWQRISAE